MQCSKNEIGDRIAELRRIRDISQEKLASKLNVSREVVAKWENGTRDLKTEHTIALADYFGVTCDEILRGIKAENVDICKKTGLSDEAITKLEHCKLVGSSAATNQILTHPMFGAALHRIWELKQYLPAFCADEYHFIVPKEEMGKLQADQEGQGMIVPGASLIRIHSRLIKDEMSKVIDSLVEDMQKHAKEGVDNGKHNTPHE